MTSDLPDAVTPCPIVAFTSPSATGRTATLTNVACVLAAAGKRVLILDRGVEAPRVHDYLGQFQTDTGPPAAQLLGADLVGESLDPAAGADTLTTYQYKLPMESGDIDAIVFAESLPHPHHGPGHDAALRNRIRAAAYDYVLIDIPTAPTPPTLKRLAGLCDTVVVCFHPRTSDVSKAAALAGAVAESVPVRLAILAVAVQFDDQDPDLARRAKDRIQTAFGDLASSTVSTTNTEIPYQPVGAVFDQAIAMLRDEPEDPIPAAYARITDSITGGEIDRIRPVPARVRDSYRYALGIGALSAQPRIFLAYAAEDRRWADWIQNLLESSGAKVDRLPSGDAWLGGPVRPAVLVVANPRLARSQTGRHALELIERWTRTPSLTNQFDLLVVEVSGRTVGAQLTDSARISFVDCPEAVARRRLLRHFVLFDRLERDPAERPVYFPARPAPPHSRSSLPPRNKRFVGRDTVLQDIRDRLLSQRELEG